MSSILGRWLSACGVLLALALAFVLVRDERGDRARGSFRQSAPAPVAGASAAELSAPGAVGAQPDPSRTSGVVTRDPLPAFEADPDAGVPGAYLRLLERDGHGPLAKRVVQLVFSESENLARRLVSMESTASGLLDLADHVRDESDEATVLVRSTDCRMRFEPSTLRLGELGRTAAQAPGLVLVARPSANLRGRALDAASGEPLAQLALRVSTSSEPSLQPDAPPASVCSFRESEPWMVTDAEGRFAGTEGYPLGLLRLETPHGEEAEVVLAAEGAPVEARFRVGPRILLDFHPPGGRAPTDFIAGLYRDPSEAGTSEELRDPVSPWTPPGWKIEWSNAAAVFAGPPPWTRLAADELAHPLPSFLILLSRDGAAKGVARLDEFERYRREPLFVDVRELGALVGTVRPADEDGGPRDCELALYRPEDPADEPSGSRWLSAPGSFRFQGLQPGPYRLELKADRCAPTTLDLSVPRATPLELVLPAVEQLAEHALEGRIRTESGQALDGQAGRAQLTNVWGYLVGGDRSRSGGVRWSDGVGSFRLEELLPGEYRLFPQFARGQFVLEPESTNAVVPGAALEWLVRDGGEHQRFELSIVAPAAGAQVQIEGHSERYARLSVSHWQDVAPLDARPGGRPAQRIELGPYPAGAFTSLVVTSEGVRSRRLTAGDFEVVGEVWRAEVTLVPGWSARLALSDEQGEGLPGIVLALDGVPLPASDAFGRVELELDAKPARLALVTPGWELVEHHSWDDWGTLFANGEFTLENGRLDVFLRRTR